MRPLFFITQNKLPLTIIPDTMAHVDGHPVLTFTYSIYKGQSEELLQARTNRQHLENIHDPDFMGVITFEAPGKMFTYTPHNGHSLESREVEEVIEFLNEFRDNPAHWKFSL